MTTKWRYYFQQLLIYPPHVTWRKFQRKARLQLKRKLGWLQTRLFDTNISDAMFLKALDNRFTSLDQYLDAIVRRQEPKFFLDNIQQQVELLQQRFPETVLAMIAVADQVCEHRFDLLGSGPTYLGHPVDWHSDFKTGYHFNPRQYYADIRPAPYPGGYDIKVPWELSRCQHFSWLGQAYWLSGDEKYAREFVAQVTDWIERNPNKLGVNWACTMDVAIRAVNWLWAYHFFKDAPALTDEFLLTFFKSLLAHGRYIIDNLEWSETLTSNHYLSNVAGLVYLGILLPGFKEARYWREFGLQELEKEMFKQVYPDGVDFEASTAYHRLVTEMFLSATLLARLNRYHFSTAYMDRLEKMLEFILYATKPDGSMPLIGDNDNGRLHRLKVWQPPEREWVDYRYLLAIGAVLFARDDFAQAAGDQWEEAIWFWGERALLYRQNLEGKQLLPLQLESRSFPDAGWYIMRHWDMYMFISAGPNGQNGNGGHAHNDKLSFELYANGQTWIVDPGMYVYTPDYEARNQFRTTLFHNTVIVDDQEQNPLSLTRHGVFQLPDVTRTKVKLWSANNEYVLFMGEHYGYERLSPPVIHKRIVFFDKLLSVWIICDQTSERPNCQVATCLHLAPNTQLTTAPNIELFLPQNKENKVVIHLLQDNLPIFTISDALASFGYGTKRSAPILKWMWDDEKRAFGFVIITNSLGAKNTEQISNAYRRYCEALEKESVAEDCQATKV